MSAEPIKDTPATEPRPIENTPVATEAPAAEAPVAEAKTEVTEAAPATTTDLPKEEKVGNDEVKIEAQPAAGGNLGYKAPGLLHQFRFSPRYFWFGDDALDENAISNYLKTEKVEHKNHNAAHASQTGKGLLLFAKREEDKSAPQGILNLSDASDVTKEGFQDFSLKIHGHKHTFQAPNKSERDSWVVAVEKAVEEAKGSREGVVNSEGYKSNLSKYGKPAAVGAGVGAAAVGTKAATSKPDDKVHDGTTQGAATTAATSETAKKDDTKSRSQSRKRGSIFGKVLGKKEEPEEKKVEKEQAKEERKEAKEEKKAEKQEAKEEKKAEKQEAKEEKKEAKEEAKAEKQEAKEEKKAEKEAEKEEKKQAEADHHKEETDAAVATGTAAGAAVAAEESKPKDETKPKEESKTPASTLKSKRGSVFGSMPFFGKKKEESTKKDEEAPPAVPAKDPQPVSATAPQLDNPVKPEDATAPAAPVAEPKDNAAKDATEAAAPAAAATAATGSSNKESEKSESSKGGLLGFLKQKEAQFESKREEKKEAKAEDKAEKEAEKDVKKPSTEAKPAAATEKPVASSPVGDTTPKEKRRSSFFSTLGKKDKKPVDTNQKKSESAVSDAEGTDNEKKSNKLQGLFRKASKSVKGSNGATADSAAPPVPAKEDEVAKEGGVTDKAAEVPMETPSVEATAATAPSNDAAATAVPETTTTSAAPEATTENKAPEVAASA